MQLLTLLKFKKTIDFFPLQGLGEIDSTKLDVTALEFTFRWQNYICTVINASLRHFVTKQDRLNFVFYYFRWIILTSN